MVTYLLRDQHLFNHLHLRDLVRIHLSAARPKCAREVDLSTPSKGSWEMKSLTLHVSVNWHLRSGLRPFSRVSMTMGQRSSIRSPKTSLHLGQSSSCSTPSIGRPEAPLVQEGNLKTCPWSPHHRAHGGEEERLLKFLTIVYPTNKPAVELVTPLPSSTPLDRTSSDQPVKYPPDISQLHSREICYCG